MLYMLSIDVAVLAQITGGEKAEPVSLARSSVMPTRTASAEAEDRALHRAPRSGFERR
jgi:hypothetical protein